MSSKRELRSSGSTAGQALDATKLYKLNSSGAVVEATTVAGTDIVFSGSKSSLRRLNDLERNVSILAAKAFTDDGSGTGDSGNIDYAKTAGKWITARTLSLTGDVTGSVNIDGSGNASLSTTIAANSVALGTDTTGNYMVNVSAGTGISVSHTQGEGSTATISVTNGVYTTDTGTVTNTMLAGSIANAKLANSSVTVGTTAISLGSSSTTLAGLTSVTSTGFTGALTGNASTATTLQTARTINGVSFDGSANVTVHTAGTGISISGTTVTNSDLGSSQNIYKNISDGTTTAAAGSNNDTIKFRAGTGITAVVGSNDATHGDNVLITNTGVTSIAATAPIAVSASTGSTTVSISAATTSAAGSMSAADKSKLDGIASGATANTGTVTSVSGTAPIVVATGTTTPAISISAATTTAAGSMSAADKSKLDGIASGATANTGTVTSVATGTGLTGGTITTSGTISLASGVIATTGTYSSVTVDTYGRVTAGSNPGYVTSSGVTSIATSNGISGGTITSTGTLSLSGSYTGTWAVTGGITATGEVTAYFSDKNLKKDIVEITDPIAKVMSLRGVTFRPNETALALGITDKEEVGVIAQEVEAVLPQLVTPSAFAGYKTVKYDKLTALLLEAVKAQQLQIDALRAEIAKLGGSAKTEL